METTTQTIEGILEQGKAAFVPNEVTIRLALPASGHYWGQSAMVSMIGVNWQVSIVGDYTVVYDASARLKNLGMNTTACRWAAERGEKKVFYGPVLITQSWRMSRII